mgnify:FL=1
MLWEAGDKLLPKEENQRPGVLNPQGEGMVSQMNPNELSRYERLGRNPFGNPSDFAIRSGDCDTSFLTEVFYSREDNCCVCLSSSEIHNGHVSNALVVTREDITVLADYAAVYFDIESAAVRRNDHAPI